MLGQPVVPVVKLAVVTCVWSPVLGACGALGSGRVDEHHGPSARLANPATVTDPDQANVIESPSTEMSTASSADVAGPEVGDPSSRENRLP